MKTTFIIALTTLLISSVRAQIPNAGFESWTTVGTYETPNQWGNMNPATAATGIFTTLKGNPGASGNYFIKLTTKDVGGTVTPGIIVSGLLNTATWQPKSGFAYTDRAEKLTGKYQYMGYNNDVATISAWLTKWNTNLNKRDTIASLKNNTSGMVHVWTSFGIPFVYKSTENPDTAVIMISSSSVSPKKNSFIWVDDLSLDGLVTSLKTADPLDGLEVFPSPAIKEVNVAFNSKNFFKAKLQILDVVGNVINNTAIDVQPGANLFKTDLSKLKAAAGMYFVCLRTPEGVITRKFIISK
jgi:hypothetical protein